MSKNNTKYFKVVEFDFENGEATLEVFDNEKDAAEMAIELNRNSKDENKVYLVDTVFAPRKALASC